MKKLLPAALALSALLTACPRTTPPIVEPPADIPLVRTLDFTGFDGKVTLRTGGSKKLSLDAEPEYIAVSADGKTAYVTLQESNGVATVDIAGGVISAVTSLGLKDHSLPGNGLDASDRDGAGGKGAINIQNWPVKGAYMPDSIASISVGGKTYLLTANEGDGRDYKGFADEVRVKDLKLDPTAFPNAADLQKDAALGRLTVSSVDADTDGDGDADVLVAFGARSMTVWDSDMKRVADTGDLFGQKTAQISPTTFNSNGSADTFDTRSDNKGAEPEGVTTGVLGGKTFAFVGMERASGVAVLDVSNPAAPAWVDYAHFQPDPAAAPDSAAAGDLGPEGLLFIPAADSSGAQPLLVVSNEVSGSVTLYGVATDGKLTLKGRYQFPNAYSLSAAEISAYDKASKKLFVVNGQSKGLSVLDISMPSAPRLAGQIDLSKYGAGANSVAVHNGVVAVAVEAAVKTDPGKVALLNTDGSERAPAITVGALPDMLTFTPDGQFIVVANEGEPNDDYTIDPAGSVSIINVGKALNP
ncbi:choice-of-anchor I family protein [Deinococcus arenicola]|uniref:Choice-of-anchor I family protein n=1 Tax=Deinococcus arenicola TaxID=2994950 RepID=A0ABU4DTJ8_9DEIO|nr:choice-of-anchor I family protein [Deinococcus sp. ZS9-10]MDV6375766.1 choice-of-anchor I family protein [Deinococcus sp. ZS9-10]